MGLKYNVYLNGKVFGCKQCKTHLANYEEIISRVSTYYSITPLPCLPFPSVLNLPPVATVD